MPMFLLASAVLGLLQHAMCVPLMRRDATETAYVAASSTPSSFVEVSTATEEWAWCAPQWAECRGCPGKTRWGSKDKWMEVQAVNGTVKCDVNHLADVAPGADDKHCECSVTPGTPHYQSLNPAMLMERKDTSAVMSCETFKKGQSDGVWGAKNWEAVEGLCSPDWDAAQTGITKAGPRAIKAEKLNDLMTAWVDPRFRDIYNTFYKDGAWLDRAFVNYFAEFGSGKHAKMTEELIKSVHMFSDYPIVVVHFGMAAPIAWTPEQFPRLILLHAHPMPNGKSFNYNKLRAMLMARARTGVQLDSDEFVAPGVDAIFQRTEDEVTEKYALPIMPAHFLTDKGPKDGGSWWPRFCTNKADVSTCTRQTLRWAHAHPTYTYWALPFIGKWLRRQLRDERLPALQNTTGGPSFGELVVADIPEDEDLLNVALWEDGATKQWCKFDVPDPSDFKPFMDMGKANGGRETHNYSLAKWPELNEIGRDPRFHPNGVPEVFYTAHHAVNPEVSAKFVSMLETSRAAHQLPAAITYHGRVFESGMKLSAVYPEVNCLI